MNEFHAVSLCEVTQINNPKLPNLKRIADYSEKADSFHLFYVKRDSPAYYDNQQFLFAQSGPINAAGMIGIWEWTAGPQTNSSGKPYIEAKFRSDLTPIRVDFLDSKITLENTSTTMHSIEMPLEPSANYFLCFSNKGESTVRAVFCEKEILEKRGMQRNRPVYGLKPDVYNLPLYELHYTEFLHVEAHKQKYTFYTHTIPSVLIRRLLVMPYIEVVRSIILSYAEKINLQKYGITSRSDRQNVRNFLRSVEVWDIYQEVSSKCYCSLNEAEHHVKEFIEQAELTLDGLDNNTKILEALVLANTELAQSYKTKAEQAVKQAWKEENSEDIKKLDERRKHADEEIRQMNEELQKSQRELTSLKEQAETEHRKILDLRQQNKEEQAVGERAIEVMHQQLEEAHNDIGAFLARYSLFSPFPAMDFTAATIAPEQHSYLYGEALESELDKADDYLKWIDFLCDELREAGIGEKRILLLAAYLCAAAHGSIPVLLAGPNAPEIADAFSAATYGRTAGRMLCSGQWNEDTFQQMKSSEDPVIVIENPWNGRWIDFLCHRLYSFNKTIFITISYTEDLIMEPASLYNYMLPVFTEYFVKSTPTCKWNGSSRIQDFKFFDGRMQRSGQIRELCRRLPISEFCSDRLSSVLADAVGMVDDNDDKQLLPYYCGVLPIAMALGKRDSLVDWISGSVNLKEKVKKELMNWIGETEV